MTDDPSPDSDSPHPQRTIQSFVRRRGRLSPAQQRALEELGESLGPPAGSQLVDFDHWYGRKAPVLLEIGFGNGDALHAYALAHPDWNCVGFEVYPPGIGALLNAVDRDALENVRVVQDDAVAWLTERIAPDALDRTHVFFPDPWHKKRHHKRRLIQPDFVVLLTSRLRVGGELHLATDWAPYAEQMLEVLEAAPDLENLHPTYAPRSRERPLTRFERRGERLGHEVFDLAFRRYR